MNLASLLPGARARAARLVELEARLPELERELAAEQTARQSADTALATALADLATERAALVAMTASRDALQAAESTLSARSTALDERATALEASEADLDALVSARAADVCALAGVNPAPPEKPADPAATSEGKSHDELWAEHSKLAPEAKNAFYAKHKKVMDPGAR